MKEEKQLLLDKEQLVMKKRQTQLMISKELILFLEMKQVRNNLHGISTMAPNQLAGMEQIQLLIQTKKKKNKNLKALPKMKMS